MGTAVNLGCCGGGKLHCNSLKIKRLRYILTFAPRNAPCRNRDCRSDVARGHSAEHLTARSAVPSPAAGCLDPVIVPRCIEPPATRLAEKKRWNLSAPIRRYFLIGHGRIPAHADHVDSAGRGCKAE